MVDFNKCEVLNMYYAFLEDDDARNNTILKYKTNIEYLYNYFSNKLKIDINTKEDEYKLLKAIDNDEVEVLIRFMRDNPYDNNKYYTANTINNKINTYVSYFKYVVENKHIRDYSPFSGVKQVKESKVKQKKKIIEILDKVEYNKIIEMASVRQSGDRNFKFNSIRNKFLVMLTYSTGIRCEEILSAKMSWLEEIPQGYMINIPKEIVKNHINKRLPITNEVYQVFQDYLIERDKLKYKDDNIILSDSGKKLTINAYNNWLEKITKQADINKNITSHCARHFFTTRANELGVDKDMIYRIGGWVIDGMAENYCHDKVLDERKIEICNRIIS